MNPNILFTPEIADALVAKAPIVALESTIISHGMPFPHNLEVAREVEKTIRDHGAIPATICIIKGKIHIGLSNDELEKFAFEKDVFKCSRRDLGYVIAKKMTGATTVASTMLLASLAGIRVFATGGIGGVHRMAESTFDVSADLPEFTKSKVTVISAGAKAILDLPKTLEFLETLGVPVVGYQTTDFPGFYTRGTGIKLQMHANSSEEISELMKSRDELKMSGGILIANPIPQEFELDIKMIESAIDEALQNAAKEKIQGKEITPFLLSALNQITAGKSQIANKALVLNNAKIGAEIAVSWSKIDR